ncbi:MAG: chloride channel protein [Gemmatimonadota bacterium]|nr:chloride channel protein [Gemmatimonadota bacterium]
MSNSTAEHDIPRLADESQWYSEHTALLVSTLKWALLGAGAGVCVGYGTRAFLWAISESSVVVHALTRGAFSPFWLLPLALPLCVLLIRTFAPDARGHGTEAVIAAVHRNSGRVNWKIAPIKLIATVITLAFGGSVGKEGPAAQIGASLTSLFADLLRLNDADRRRLVICGISAGFAAVFGTPVSGALFGIEVLYLGRIDYTVIFPAMVAGIVGHLACGVQPPFPVLHDAFGNAGQVRIILTTLAAGAFFGMIALLLIESMRATDRFIKRFEVHPYVLAAIGGAVLVALYAVTGDRYAGLGTETINAVLSGGIKVSIAVFLLKIVATTVTLETGGSGGILTPIFFIGATSGAALAPLFGVSPNLLAAFGFVSVLAAAANTPLAAAVMAIEVLPAREGVYAALAAATAFLMVGHRSVYASQKLGFSKSAGLYVPLGGTIGELDIDDVRIRKGTLAERVHSFRLPRRSQDIDIDQNPHSS